MSPTSETGLAAPTRPLQWAALATLAAALTLPFLGKAFHIDDTFYLAVTRNVVADPLDPYAGEIDWWHRPRPIWEGDSNPPLLNYWLAPVMAVAGASEIALHAAMAPFVLLLVAALWDLGRRFTSAPAWVVGFIATSAGVVVSGNIMRDVPAAALATAAVAAFVRGSDRRDARWLAAGSLAIGLACLTKYSALVIAPVIYLYALLHGRVRQLAWAAVPLALLGAWCAHNQWVYGEWHLTAQLGRAFNRPGHGWEDNVAAIPMALGSLVYLAPAALARIWAGRDRTLLVAASIAVVGAALGIHVYTRGGAGLQFQLWNVSGAALLGVCAASGLRSAVSFRRDADARDALFLSVWLAVPLVFSSLSVPFQAVRHFLPVLPPLVLLCFRLLAPVRAPALLGALLVLQVGVTAAVARVDAATADAYRRFAREAHARAIGAGLSETAEIWFVGHWGWMHYAQQAGLRQLHVGGPVPAPGDALIVPRYVDKGRVLPRLPELADRLVKVDEIAVREPIPLRTVHPDGAGFYALFTRRGSDRPSRVPYRYLPAAPLEVFEIFRVR